MGFRNGKNNVDYRKFIKTKIIANLSQGDVEVLIGDSYIGFRDVWNDPTYNYESSALAIRMKGLKSLVEAVVNGEIIKKPISSNSYPISTILRIQGILDFSDANGGDISAIGLYDSDRDLVALKHTSPRPETSDTRFEIEWDKIL